MLEITVRHKRKRLRVINAYCPPPCGRARRNTAQMITELGEHLDERDNTGDVVVLGDLNAKNTIFGAHKTDGAGRALAEVASDGGLQLLNDPTATTYMSHN